MARDKDFAEHFRNLPCEVCGNYPPNHGHHIKTFGSGGADELWNGISLCFKHHREIHDLGIKRFVERYPKVRYALNSKGWYLCSVLNKWFNDLLCNQI